MSRVAVLRSLFKSFKVQGRGLAKSRRSGAVWPRRLFKSGRVSASLDSTSFKSFKSGKVWTQSLAKSDKVLSRGLPSLASLASASAAVWPSPGLKSAAVWPSLANSAAVFFKSGKSRQSLAKSGLGVFSSLAKSRPQVWQVWGRLAQSGRGVFSSLAGSRQVWQGLGKSRLDVFASLAGLAPSWVGVFSSLAKSGKVWTQSLAKSGESDKVLSRGLPSLAKSGKVLASSPDKSGLVWHGPTQVRPSLGTSLPKSGASLAKSGDV